MTTDSRLKNGIYKRGDIYYIDIQVNGQRIRKQVGPDRKTAELVIAEIRKQRSLAKLCNDFSGLDALLKPKSTMTFAEAASIYLDTNIMKHSTALAYDDRLKRLMPEFGDCVISKITSEQIRRFQTNMGKEVKANGKPISPQRVNNVVNLLRTILSTCVKDKLIAENPADAVSALRCEQTDIDPLTRDELDLALSKIPAEYQHLFVCLAWTGARPGELKALRWRDIDWQRNEIKIEKSRYKDQESTTKTKSSKRVIEIFPPVRMALEALKAGQTILDMNGHVFLDRNGKPINRTLDRIWAVALQKAGIRHRESYQLRHTFASICLSAGIEPGRIGKMLGHSGPAITLKHYARFIVNKGHTDLRFMEALFNSGSDSSITLHKTFHKA